MARQSHIQVALETRNYPRNAWWVAGLSSDVTDKPVQRWMLELPIVLYRGADGRVAALDDRCPHRWAPLSTGVVIANVLDLSHFAFVHANTLAVTDRVRPPAVERGEREVSYRQEFLGTPLPAHYGVPTGIGCDRAVDRRAWGSYVSPAL